jgi:hypothetical protein
VSVAVSCQTELIQAAVPPVAAESSSASGAPLCAWYDGPRSARAVKFASSAMPAAPLGLPWIVSGLHQEWLPIWEVCSVT